MINKCLPRRKGREGGVQDALIHSFPTENEGLVHAAFSASQSGPARELEPSLRPRYCPPGGPAHLGYCAPEVTASLGVLPPGGTASLGIPSHTIAYSSLTSVLASPVLGMLQSLMSVPIAYKHVYSSAHTYTHICF